MSTNKVKDGPTTKTTSTTRKTKKPTGTPKTDVSKVRNSVRTSSRIQTKPEDDEEKKLIKQVVKPHVRQNINNKIISRPTPAKKVVNTTKKLTSRPVTPPSSRVSKTQFFPSKKMYSNALKTVTHKEVLDRDSVSPDTSSISERPRTATLRKGSIVNNNIVGPEVSSKKIRVPVSVNNRREVSKKENTPINSAKHSVAENPTIEYEDDFESYESDFEEYESSDSTTNVSSGTISISSEGSESDAVDIITTSKRVGSAGTDDEKKLDSGNYELPEYKHKQILDNIKETIERESTNLQHDHSRSNLGSLSDEGFEDGKSLQFINFLGAQKKYKHRKSIEMRRKRGEEILSMIRLDLYSFTLFDLAPVPYDIFIKNFGNSNTVQESVQTGEDDLDEEIQTEEILYHDKWTQCPPCIEKKIEAEEDFWEIYKCNYLGVGGGFHQHDRTKSARSDSGLEKFLLSSGNLILDILDEEHQHVIRETDKSSVPFSKGYILYNTQVHTTLKSRPISDVNFCSFNSNKILTVHGDKKDRDFEENFVCLWNSSNLDSPEMFFVVFGKVTSIATSSSYTNLILGGLSNGCIVTWDANENESCHKNVYNNNWDCGDILSRSPTYSTEINYGHCCKVISIQFLAKTTTETKLFDYPKVTEISSLDEEGNVIIWSVLLKERSQGKIIERQGLAHWGSVIITINTKISLKNLYPELNDFYCTALGVSHFDSNNLYISTNYGVIVHCLATGSKATVKKYLPDIQNRANCLEMCPFSSQYFMVGYDNGDINFYSRIFERPLMVLSNKEITVGGTRIEQLQWSHNRPLTFYTKDVTNTIHIWNLKVSDMFPVCSVPFKDDVLCMKLSPVTETCNDTPQNTYMIIATDNGYVYVHLLGNEHDHLPVEEFEKDKRKFLNYINRYV